MAKTIIKEVIIVLLLCLAILLILAVLLYSYIPNNKVIPELVAYKTPEDAKEVINESEADTSKVIMSYEINSSDISAAQRTNAYNPGKIDPFSTYAPPAPAEETNGANGNSTTGSTSITAGTTGNATTGGNTTGSSSTEGSVNGSTTGGTGTYYTNNGTK